MLATLIPLFDKEMNVCAYSVFAQRENNLLNPFLAGTGSLDASSSIMGLSLVDSMGIENLSGDRSCFVSVDNVSIFTDIAAQCKAPANKIALLIDSTVKPKEMYINRVAELKLKGYKIAVRRLSIDQFEPYLPILSHADYMLLDHRKINIDNARVYFSKRYPNISLVAINVNTIDEFENLGAKDAYSLYEGAFFRMPKVDPDEAVAPLKMTYIELLNIVNAPDFDLTDAADVVGHDTALVLSLLEMVNRMSVSGGISSVRHAAAMLGQKELKRWINTAVTKELCADKPSEIIRISLLRAKFCENLAKLFELAHMSQELFLMGLFSVLDVMLDKPIEEALEIVTVSQPIYNALVRGTGDLAPVLNFVREYENASWQEISRLMILKGIDMDPVFDAYVNSLEWYRDLFLK